MIANMICFGVPNAPLKNKDVQKTHKEVDSRGDKSEKELTKQVLGPIAQSVELRTFNPLQGLDTAPDISKTSRNSSPDYPYWAVEPQVTVHQTHVLLVVASLAERGLV